MRVLHLPPCRVCRGDLILVNGEHPLPRDAEGGDLVPAGPGAPDVLLERRAAVSLGRLMDELDAWGSIVPVSGWRSREEQERLYAQSLRENGEEFTRQFVARPGCSEHETGLAIDLAPGRGRARTLSARPFPTGASAGGSGSGAPILDLSCATRRGRKRSPALPMNPGISDMWAYPTPP